MKSNKRSQSFNSSCFKLKHKTSGVEIWILMPCKFAFKNNQFINPPNNFCVIPSPQLALNVSIELGIMPKLSPGIQSIRQIYLQPSTYSIKFDTHEFNGLIDQIYIDSKIFQSVSVYSFCLQCTVELTKVWNIHQVS